MGKKRTAQKVEEEKPEIWCFYCNREFDNENVLIVHQKAKHFKCEICHKKLSTAGGLVVHLIQVHKETISEIPNALPDRKSTEFEIYGMAGIPDEFLTSTMKAKKFMQEREKVNAAVPIPFGIGGFPPAPFGPPPLPPAPPSSAPFPPGTAPLPPGMAPPMPPMMPVVTAVPPMMPIVPAVPSYPPMVSAVPNMPPMPFFPAGIPGMPMPPMPGFPTMPPSVPPPPQFMPPGMIPRPAAPIGPAMPPPVATVVATVPLAPGEVRLIWTDEEYSMEERRAQLDKYKVRAH